MVRVEDVNDNSPRFPSLLEEAVVEEESNVGTPVRREEGVRGGEVGGGGRGGGRGRGGGGERERERERERARERERERERERKRGV